MTIVRPTACYITDDNSADDSDCYNKHLDCQLYIYLFIYFIYLI